MDALIPPLQSSVDMFTETFIQIAIVLGLVVVQVALGFFTLVVPELGMLHAVNALLLLLAALHAARLPARDAAAEDASAAMSGADPRAQTAPSRG
jgi:heme A synthase